MAVVLPVSVELAGGRAALTGNLGLVKPAQGDRETLAALAVEGQLNRQWSVYAEWARVGEERFGHAGVRWWIRREKLALDAGWQRAKATGAAGESGWVVGLAWYDL